VQTKRLAASFEPLEQLSTTFGARVTPAQSHVQSGWFGVKILETGRTTKCQHFDSWCTVVRHPWQLILWFSDVSCVLNQTNQLSAKKRKKRYILSFAPFCSPKRVRLLCNYFAKVMVMTVIFLYKTIFSNMLSFLSSRVYKVWVHGKMHIKSGSILLAHLTVATWFVLLWTEPSSFK